MMEWIIKICIKLIIIIKINFKTIIINLTSSMVLINNSNLLIFLKMEIVWLLIKMVCSQIKILMKDMMSGLYTNKIGLFIIRSSLIKNMKFGSSKMWILIFNKKKNCLRKMRNNKSNKLDKRLSHSSKIIQLNIFKTFNSMIFIINRYKVLNKISALRNRFKIWTSLMLIKIRQLNKFKIHQAL